MNIPKKNLDRRDLLKGFGLAGLIAGSLIDRRLAFASGGAPPRRLLMFYTPGGFFRECFEPDAVPGDDVPHGTVTFGKIRKGARQNVLDVLQDPKYASILGDLNVINGVDMRAVGDQGHEHKNGIHAALRGRPREDRDPGPFPNMSIDRVIGMHLFPDGRRPVHLKTPNINVGIGNFGYQGDIRDASNGGTGIETETLAGTWDGLFKDFVPGAAGAGPTGPSPAQAEAYERRKILSGHARGEFEALKRMLGKDEQSALDRHLDAMNEITLQVENDFKAAASGGGVARGGKMPDRPTKSYDPKRDLVPLTAEIVDVIAHGFLFDRVRIATLHTFGQNNGASYWYPGSNGGYHSGVCHGGTASAGGGQEYVVPAAMSAGRTLLRMYLDMLLKLKSIPEGNGTLLDSTTVATWSDMSDGGHHYKNPTLLLAGGGGGLSGGKRILRTGRFIKYADRGHNDYLISLAHLMGVTEWKDDSGNRKPLIQIGAARYNKGPLPGFTGT